MVIALPHPLQCGGVLPLPQSAGLATLDALYSGSLFADFAGPHCDNPF